MNETLYKCLSDSIIHSESLTPYRIVVESSTLITVLHTNVGSEIGNKTYLNIFMRYLPIFIIVF